VKKTVKKKQTKKNPKSLFNQILSISFFSIY